MKLLDWKQYSYFGGNLAIQERRYLSFNASAACLITALNVDFKNLERAASDIHG